MKTGLPHAWIAPKQVRRSCSRCGLVEIDCERNLPSQSAYEWTEYWCNGKDWLADPGCVASIDVAKLRPSTNHTTGMHGERWCFVGAFTQVPVSEWIEVVW